MLRAFSSAEYWCILVNSVSQKTDSVYSSVYRSRSLEGFILTNRASSPTPSRPAPRYHIRHVYLGRSRDAGHVIKDERQTVEFASKLLEKPNFDPRAWGATVGYRRHAIDAKSCGRIVRLIGTKNKLPRESHLPPFAS